MQGRFPIRVELESLGAKEFERILVEPDNALTKQYVALMETEEITLKITDGAVTTIAQIAAEVNERHENIGARRLHTVMEKLLEELSFEAPELGRREINITEEPRRFSALNAVPGAIGFPAASPARTFPAGAGKSHVGLRCDAQCRRSDPRVVSGSGT